MNNNDIISSIISDIIHCKTNYKLSKKNYILFLSRFFIIFSLIFFSFILFYYVYGLLINNYISDFLFNGHMLYFIYTALLFLGISAVTAVRLKTVHITLFIFLPLLFLIFLWSAFGLQYNFFSSNTPLIYKYIVTAVFLYFLMIFILSIIKTNDSIDIKSEENITVFHNSYKNIFKNLYELVFNRTISRRVYIKYILISGFILMLIIPVVSYMLYPAVSLIRGVFRDYFAVDFPRNEWLAVNIMFLIFLICFLVYIFIILILTAYRLQDTGITRKNSVIIFFILLLFYPDIILHCIISTYSSGIEYYIFAFLFSLVIIYAAVFPAKKITAAYVDTSSSD